MKLDAEIQAIPNAQTYQAGCEEGLYVRGPRVDGF